MLSKANSYIALPKEAAERGDFICETEQELKDLGAFC